jgi:hypothetical protein
MRRDKLNLNDWIARLARLNRDLESERKPRCRLTSLTVRLGLKNWLVYRAMTHEPGFLSSPLPGISLVPIEHQRPETKRR